VSSGEAVPLWVPYNLFRSKLGIVGMDAFFWDSVSEGGEARRVLLVQPATRLHHRPRGPCALKPRVAAERNLMDLERLAGSTGGPSLVSRLSRLLTTGWRVRGEVDPVEARIASRMAGEILLSDPKPLGSVAWLQLDMPKPGGAYGYIASLDSRFSSSLLRAWKFCLERLG